MQVNSQAYSFQVYQVLVYHYFLLITFVLLFGALILQRPAAAKWLFRYKLFIAFVLRFLFSIAGLSLKSYFLSSPFTAPSFRRWSLLSMFFACYSFAVVVIVLAFVRITCALNVTYVAYWLYLLLLPAPPPSGRCRYFQRRPQSLAFDLSRRAISLCHCGGKRIGTQKVCKVNVKIKFLPFYPYIPLAKTWIAKCRRANI